MTLTPYSPGTQLVSQLPDEQFVETVTRRLTDPRLKQRYAELVTALRSELFSIGAAANLSTEQIHNANLGIDSFLSTATGQSPHSLRQYLHNFRFYRRWCMAKNIPTLPIAPFHVSEYLEFLESKGRTKALQMDFGKSLKPSSIASHLSSISLLHQIAEITDITKIKRIKATMKAIRNTAARQGYMVHQQSPFRRHHLSELNVIWGDSVKPRDVRDLAFISLAYDSMLRESEMANVTFSMLSRSQKSGHYTGRISHIKGSYDGTDGQHGGRFQVSSHTYQLLVKAYEMTTDESDRDRNGLLFFPLTKGGKLNKRFVAEEQGVVYRKPLSGKAVDEIFQRAYDALLPDDVKSPWRGHSARIGRAQDLSMDGKTNQQIMQIGRWKKADMPVLYTREQDLDELF